MGKAVIVNPAETHMQLQSALQHLAEAQRDIATLKATMRFLMVNVRALHMSLDEIEGKLGMDE